MKVLYLIDSLVPGGAEQSLVTMAPGLAAAGIDLEVAYLHERDGLQGPLREAGIPLHSLDGPGGRRGWAQRGRAVVREAEPDLVHTTLFEANLVGRAVGTLARVPVSSSLVNVTHGVEQRAAPGLTPWKLRVAYLVDALSARRVARFHAVSGWVADTMAARLHIPRQRIDVVPRGRDPARLGARTPERRALARAGLGVAPDVPLIVAAGRQEHQKGLDLLVEAMVAVLDKRPSARLVVAGREGNQSALLRAQVDRLGLEAAVGFLGTRGDVPELLCAADVVAVPSRWEGLPNVVVEAAGLRAPVVASDIPPAREVLPDGRYACLVSPGSPDALAGGILATLADPEEAEARARMAHRRFLERFTVERVAEEMAAFFRRAADTGRGGL